MLLWALGSLPLGRGVLTGVRGSDGEGRGRFGEKSPERGQQGRTLHPPKYHHYHTLHIDGHYASFPHATTHAACSLKTESSRVKVFLGPNSCLWRDKRQSDCRWLPTGSPGQARSTPSDAEGRPLSFWEARKCGPESQLLLLLLSSFSRVRLCATP